MRQERGRQGVGPPRPNLEIICMSCLWVILIATHTTLVNRVQLCDNICCFEIVLVVVFEVHDSRIKMMIWSTIWRVAELRRR